MSFSKIKTLFLILLFASSCVSKKKYAELTDRKAKEALTFQSELSKIVSERDSLRARVVLLDSLLAKEKDKNSKIIKSPYKERSKETSGKKTKMKKGEALKSKAVQIYNFCKMIQWPENYQSDEIVIAIAGDSQMLKELKDYTVNKTINSKKLRIEKYMPGSKSPVHVFYLPDGYSSKFYQFKSVFKNKPTLFITDDPELYSQGAHISFRESDEKIKFVINKTAAERAGLKISPELVKFAAETY